MHKPVHYGYLLDYRLIAGLIHRLASVTLILVLALVATILHFIAAARRGIVKVCVFVIVTLTLTPTRVGDHTAATIPQVHSLPNMMLAYTQFVGYLLCDRFDGSSWALIRSNGRHVEVFMISECAAHPDVENVLDHKLGFEAVSSKRMGPLVPWEPSLFESGSGATKRESPIFTDSLGEPRQTIILWRRRRDGKLSIGFEIWTPDRGFRAEPMDEFDSGPWDADFGLWMASEGGFEAFREVFQVACWMNIILACLSMQWVTRRAINSITAARELRALDDQQPVCADAIAYFWRGREGGNVYTQLLAEIFRPKFRFHLAIARRQYYRQVIGDIPMLAGDQIRDWSRWIRPFRLVMRR